MSGGFKNILVLIFLIGNILFSQNIDHWETVIYADQEWAYFIGNTEPDTEWRKTGFDDRAWLRGKGGIGYGDDDDRTAIDPCISLYLRKKIDIINKSKIERAVLHMDYDDGFVAYINNVEIARANIEGEPPAYDQTTPVDHEAGMYDGNMPEDFTISKQTIEDIFIDGENVLAIQVHNVEKTSSDMSAIAFLSVAINDGSTDYGQLPDWFKIAEPLKLDSNLPIIVINTNGRRIPDEPKITAEMGVIYNGKGKRNKLSDTFNDYAGQIGIELRGNTSLDFPKKSYALETRKPDGENNNVPLLGLPQENDWILYAPYSDKSLMRNDLTFNLAMEIGRYAPRTRFCELVLNGEYRGIYVLMEKIKIDKDRIDIAKLTESDTGGDELTGGYIIKLDWEDPKSSGWNSPIDGTLFHYHHPQKDKLLPVQKKYIKDFITEFEYALDGDDYKDPEKGYRKYIDVGSFIDYFMSVELAHNADSYRISTFMYKDKDSNDSLLHYGPLWDFNLAYGNQDEGPFGTPYQWSWQIGLDDVNFWWHRLLSDPSFKKQVVDRWFELRQDLLHTTRIFFYIDSVTTVLDEAQVRNFERWPVLGEWVWPNVFVGETYQEEVDYLKNFIIERVKWVDENIESMDVTYEPEDPEDPWEPDDPPYIPDEKLPGDFILGAFPNPFTGTTTLNYKNLYDTHIRITIYDILGKRVRYMVNGNQNLGEYNVTWNGTDDFGNRVANGIYFITYEAEWEIVKKIKILKLR